MEFAVNYPADAGINDSYTQAAAKVVGVFSFMWEQVKGLLSVEHFTCVRRWWNWCIRALLDGWGGSAVDR